MKIDIVNVSGGVDSTACYLLALERREKTGRDFRAVFADTGNEHEITIDYINNLAIKTGGPEVRTVRADFSQRIAVRRIGLEMQLETGIFREGWDEQNTQRVLRHLYTTENPFLDMCMWKGRFPSSTRRFCTVECKMAALKQQAIEPAICEVIAGAGTAQDVICWVGIRRDESDDRANALEFELDHLGNMVYRPLVEWPKSACFDLLKKHGIESNLLYRLGCGRVGCMPCIHTGKNEMCEISKRFSHHIDRIREWERIVGLCSKRGISTFFPSDTTPGTEDTRSHIDAVVQWSQTKRGGVQMDLTRMLPPMACSSMYGLCE